MGRLPREALQLLESHVAGCRSCQAALETLDDLSDGLMLSIRQAVADRTGFEDELHELARRAGAASLEAIQAVAGGADHGQASAESRVDEEILTQLGQYKLLERLGRGGMGTVYKALHPKLKRVVAVKVLPAQRINDPRAVSRFHREMEAVGRLDHPNIVRAYDAGEAEGRHFLVMEFVEGLTLSELIRSDKRVSTAEACEAIRQAAIGIQHAHDHGLVHRDIKPSNLMRAANGTVKVLDLGLAHFEFESPAAEEEAAIDRVDTAGGKDVTHTGQAIGTLGYMSPEQVLGQPRLLDHRTDIYSLGLTLYELLTGRPAFPGDGRQRRFRQILEEGPPLPHELNPSIPDKLEAIVLRAIAKEPSSRYATAEELADDLGRFLGYQFAEGQVSAQTRTRHRRWVMLAAVAGCLIAMVPLLLLITGGRRTTADQPATKPGISSSNLQGEKTNDPPLGPWIDLLPSMNLARDRIDGIWKREGGAIIGDTASGVWGKAIAMLPVKVEGDYDLQFEFTRTRGDDSVTVILPVASRGCAMQFSAREGGYGRYGRFGGLEVVDGRLVVDLHNPAIVHPSRLTNGQRYRALAKVRTTGQDAAVEVLLDAKPYVRWSGAQSSLQFSPYWKVPERKRPALGTFNSVVAFHSAKLRAAAKNVSLIAPGEMRKLEGHRGAVRSIALSPDALKAAVASPDAALRVWDLTDGFELRRFESSLLQINGALFYTDGRHLITAAEDGQVILWNGGPRALSGPGPPMNCLALSKDGRYLAAGGQERTVCVWNVADGEEIHRWTGFSGPVDCVAISTLGRRLLAGGSADRTVHLLDLSTKQESRLTGHRAGVLCVAFAPDGPHAASGDRGGGIHLWDSATGKAVRTLKGYSDEVCSLAFSTDGRFLLSAGKDGTVRLWDVRSGQESHRFEGHTKAVRTVSFCEPFGPHGYSAISGSDDGTVRLWRLPDVVAETCNSRIDPDVRPVEPEDDLTSQRWVDLLKPVDPAADRVQGTWLRDGHELIATHFSRCSRLMLPIEVDGSVEGSYELEVEFTRHFGNSGVDVLLPVGKRHCDLEFGGWGGAVHGLAMIDGIEQNDNRTPAVKRPGRLINGRRYGVLISVRTKGESATIEVWLGDSLTTGRADPNRADGVLDYITRDDSPLVHWAGKQTSLESRHRWRLPNPRRPGLGQHDSTVTFHSARFRLITGKASWIGEDSQERKRRRGRI